MTHNEVVHLQKQAAKWEAQVGILATRIEQLEATISNLIRVLESARRYLDPSPIVQGKIDKVIQKARGQ